MRKFCIECMTWVLKDTCNCSNPRIFSSKKENRFDFKDNKIVCGCGNDTFKSTQHIDNAHSAIFFYKCSKCSATIKEEIKRAWIDRPDINVRR